jgi:hypothetical protein
MPSLLRRLPIAAAAVAVLAAVPATASADPPPLKFPTCAEVAPHATLTYDGATTQTATSAGGGYENGFLLGCRRFVVDVTVPAGGSDFFNILGDAVPQIIQLKPTKAACEARRDGVSYYKKTGATFALVASKARVGTWQNGTCKMLDSQTGQPGALTGIGGHATTAFGTYRAAVYARDGSGYRTVRVRTWPF